MRTYSQLARPARRLSRPAMKDDMMVVLSTKRLAFMMGRATATSRFGRLGDAPHTCADVIDGDGGRGSSAICAGRLSPWRPPPPPLQTPSPPSESIPSSPSSSASASSYSHLSSMLQASILQNSTMSVSINCYFSYPNHPVSPG
jgi:hypothetical protein